MPLAQRNELETMLAKDEDIKGVRHVIKVYFNSLPASWQWYDEVIAYTTPSNRRIHLRFHVKDEGAYE